MSQQLRLKIDIEKSTSLFPVTTGGEQHKNVLCPAMPAGRGGTKRYSTCKRGINFKKNLHPSPTKAWSSSSDCQWRHRAHLYVFCPQSWNWSREWGTEKGLWGIVEGMVPPLTVRQALVAQLNVRLEEWDQM